MPSVTIKKTSSHKQNFEAHGFPDKPAIITVTGHRGIAEVHSPGQQQVSRAIIALHDDQEGEQAEVTFMAFQMVRISITTSSTL